METSVPRSRHIVSVAPMALTAFLETNVRFSSEPVYESIGQNQ